MRVEDTCAQCNRAALVGMPPGGRLSVVVWSCKVCSFGNVTVYDWERDELVDGELGQDGHFPSDRNRVSL